MAYWGHPLGVVAAAPPATAPTTAVPQLLGVLSLGQKYGVGRVEEASTRALKHRAVSWKSAQAIVKSRRDPQRKLDLAEHENLHGVAHYQSSEMP